MCVLLAEIYYVTLYVKMIKNDHLLPWKLTQIKRLQQKDFVTCS
jgi:hypothetical protein